MENLVKTSIKISNYKCFGNKEQGFERILPINIIIGRNNSGKSTLLELIEYTVTNNVNFPEAQWHDGKKPEIILYSPLIEKEIRQVFKEDTNSERIPGRNHWEYGKAFVGTKFKWRLVPGQEKRFISIDECSHAKCPIDEIPDAFKLGLAATKENPFKNRVFKRLYAERDLLPEEDRSYNLQGNGHGMTNIIQQFINKADLPRELVDKVFFKELNLITNPDINFIDIVCQQVQGNKWEIYLEEELKGSVPLSHTGSGIKTIIMVLVFIHLIPVAEKKKLSDYVFAFEELENNLHPALLRRLLNYLYKKAEINGPLFFLTTHSNVSIDLFSKSQDAQIVHITHDGKQGYCKTVKTYIENKGILDDLDIRASDLLQANGIIWVEGPSDRIYINKWIDLCSKGSLQENIHYQCIVYGGRLLAHLSSYDPGQENDGIRILGINRNAIILIDSDKKNKQASLNSTKKRIKGEIEANNGFAWVTKGKEIENYIPKEAVANLVGKKEVKQVGQFDNFFDYLDKIKKGEGKRYLVKKPMFAESISQFFTKENISNVLDLSASIEEVCKRIKSWNSIE